MDHVPARMGLDSLRAAISSLESRTDSKAHTKVAAKLQQYLSDDSRANAQELKDEAFDYFKALREASAITNERRRRRILIRLSPFATAASASLPA